MSPPRRSLALALVAACGAPPAERPPAAAIPATPPPVPTDSPVTPVPKDSPTAAPAPSPPADPPAPGADPPQPPGARRWHLAAVREGSLALHRLADGAVAVRGGLAFAVAPARSGPLKREPGWLRGLALFDPEHGPAEVTAFGGRWPELAAMSVRTEGDRSAIHDLVLRWQGGAWMADRLPAPAGLRPFYAAVVGWPEGQVAAARGHTLVDEDDPGHADDPPAPPRARPVIDRLTEAGRAVGPWPALPPGPPAVDLLALDGGGLAVLRSGPVVQRWLPDARAWKQLPAVGYTATGYYDSPTLAGRDPARLYLFSCPDTADDSVRARFHRSDGGRWVRVPTPTESCIYSLAEADDGATWIVAGDELYRDDPGDPIRWEPVALPTLALPGREAAAWRPGRFYGEPWREFPPEPRAPQPLRPGRVLAFGPDDVWLVAHAGPARYHPASDRTVVLTTRAVKSVLALPDDQLTDIEAHAQEPEVVPTGIETACHDVVLDLGDLTDAPADARPPAFAAALAGHDDLRDLVVVAADIGGRFGVQALWFDRSPPPTDGFTLLTALAERLRDAHPRVRLVCRTPLIARVLPPA